MMRSREHIDGILARLTLREKIGQLTMASADMAGTGPTFGGDYLEGLSVGEIGSVLNLWGTDRVFELQRIAVEETRAGIPLFFGLDVLHGLRTIFPVPLAEACAFDETLWKRTARAAAEEAASEGIDLTFAPMLDVCRDPRWGRIVEGPGEDPIVASRLAAAKVSGFQGCRLDAPGSIAATAKHFGAYGAVLAGRDYASANVSKRALDEVYWPPFKAAVAASVAAVMPSFNDLAGVPMTANATALKDLLRKRWGFGGVIISDYGAISELVTHGVARDLCHAAALALEAGVDIDMMGDAYRLGLPQALETALIDEASIDRAVRRVLSLKNALGLFDDPYLRCRGTALSSGKREATKTLARQAARRSLVLLKNAGGLLPLAQEGGGIAVIGPLADAGGEMLGPWCAAGVETEAVSLLEGVKAAFPKRRILHAKGVPIADLDPSGIAEAVQCASMSEIALLCVGESRWMSGEAASRARLDLPGIQADLARAVHGTGKPVVLLLASGRPLCVTELIEAADGALAIWFPGSAGGHAVADILSGKADPTGRLSVTWPREIGQIPIFYAQRPTGRPAGVGHYTAKYLDVPTEPLFPFAHGLSYSRVTWRRIRAMPHRVRPEGTVTLEVELRNEGPGSAEETVFVFIRDPLASIARPRLELKAVSKLCIGVNETRIARFTLSAEAFAFPDQDGNPVIEPGAIEILAGPSADVSRLLATQIWIEASRPA